MVRHAGTVAAAGRASRPGANPSRSSTANHSTGGSRSDAATTSGARSAASCRTRTAAPTSSRFRNSTTSSCTWSSACPKARTAACTCGAATSCRSTTPPASSHRHIISAESTASLRRARTWPGLPASGNRWMSRSWAGCSRYELNGTTVICNREIPGITGGAIDSAEADPGRCCSRAITVRWTTATS